MSIEKSSGSINKHRRALYATFNVACLWQSER